MLLFEKAAFGGQDGVYSVVMIYFTLPWIKPTKDIPTGF
jgi:hypothetical protein